MVIDFNNSYERAEIEYNNEENLKGGIRTGQTNIVLPTKDLIKVKGTDFRVLLAISLISNVDNNTLSGNNSRYCSIKKVDKNMNKLCENMEISTSQFRKHIKKLLKVKSNEFKLIQKKYKEQDVICYEINYLKGGFVIIPIEKVEKLLFRGSNNCIKLYSNLLWLCMENGGFIEKELTQSYLAELMGLSSNSQKSIRIAIKWLEDEGLINTRKIWESDTIAIDDDVVSSKPKSKIYYSIVV